MRGACLCSTTQERDVLYMLSQFETLRPHRNQALQQAAWLSIAGPVIIIRSVLFMATFSQWARWWPENGNKLYLAITKSLLRNNSSAAALSHSTPQYCSVISNWVISNRFWMWSDIRGALQRSDLSTESSSNSEVHVFIRLVEICHCLIAKHGCVGFPQQHSARSASRGPGSDSLLTECVWH